MGLLDTAGNVLVIRLWGKDCAAYIQALHFAFGVGAFICPILLNVSRLSYINSETYLAKEILPYLCTLIPPPPSNSKKSFQTGLRGLSSSGSFQGRFVKSI